MALLCVLSSCNKFGKDGHFTLHPAHFQQNYYEKGLFTYGIYYQKDGNLVLQPVYSPDDQSFTQVRLSDPNGTWVLDWANSGYNGTWTGNDRRSKGIVVNVPAGVKFGFYGRMLDWGREFFVYSEADCDFNDIVYRICGRRRESYPDFAAWCADHTAMTDWYCRPVKDLIYASRL